MTFDETYQTSSWRGRERNRVRKFPPDKRDGRSPAEFADWWMKTLDEQKGCCAYCGTRIELINKLIKAGLLKTRKVSGAGRRGPSLELERKKADATYALQENCALICYYCNNDKSYIYSEDEYRRFFAPARADHFNHLAQKMPRDSTS